jgi:hypothetical protein
MELTWDEEKRRDTARRSRSVSSGHLHVVRPVLDQVGILVDSGYELEQVIPPFCAITIQAVKDYRLSTTGFR